MANTVDELLASFKQLPIADQKRAYAEISRQLMADHEIPPLDEIALTHLADELFQMYDQEEMTNGTSPSPPW